MRTTDGFVLAEVDLELRGEGNVLAARQSGMPDLRHARLRRHRRLAADARTDALRMLDDERRPRHREPARRRDRADLRHGRVVGR